MHACLGVAADDPEAVTTAVAHSAVLAECLSRKKRPPREKWEAEPCIVNFGDRQNPSEEGRPPHPFFFLGAVLGWQWQAEAEDEDAE